MVSGRILLAVLHPASERAPLGSHKVVVVIKQAVDVIAEQAPRVSLVIKADLRAGVTDATAAKVETVERHLSAE
jgi:hypothetical protein